MRIGIEGFQFSRNPSGVGKYLDSLLQLLLISFPDDEFIIYSNKEICLSAEVEGKVHIRRETSLFRYLKPIVWLKLIAGFKIKKDKLDYYISAAGFLPHLSSSVKKITVVHDLNYLIVPGTMSKFHFLANYIFLKRDVRRSDFIITNSMGTSKKIHHYFKKEPGLIINPPVSDIFRKLSENTTKQTLNKYNICFPYFLSVGTMEPRKNLETTIRVMSDLHSRGLLKDHKLVCIGGKGWKNRKLNELIEKNKDVIIQLGYVEESDLPAMYNGATAFLFPSIYEGYGIPVREALKCNTQVITSDIAELRESGDNQAYYIDPLNEEEYKKKILDILNREAKSIILRVKVIGKGDLMKIFEKD